MKRFILIMVTLCILLCCTGCTFDGSSDYIDRTNGRFLPVPNQNDLYYDIYEKTVYIIFNEFAGECGYGYMSPYYANNGLPYIYNTETNSLEENSWSKISGFENWFKH